MISEIVAVSLSEEIALFDYTILSVETPMSPCFSILYC